MTFVRVLLACAAGLVVGVEAGQETRAARSVWDGVYTEPQARRGREVYARSCGGCHAEDLRGKGTAPSLVEESFMFLWEDMTLGELFERTRTLMPSDRPGSLPVQDYADVIAFILEKNGMPSGPRELDARPEDLKAIRITAQPGRSK
jgi:quinoprotein glucose dehydrogenase